MDKVRLRRIRWYLAIMIAGLVASGVTAFPLTAELKLMTGFWPHPWLVQVRDALVDTDTKYPFLAYGTDWLAFAHLMIAAAFIGPWRDPLKNRWIIDWALICCIGVIPLALLCGPIRGIPFFHRLIDCSFGVFGAIPLLCLRRELIQAERAISSSS
ncbi:MAG: hypothetical protein QM758_15070 [Armatimonas sp.]